MIWLMRFSAAKDFAGNVRVWDVRHHQKGDDQSADGGQDFNGTHNGRLLNDSGQLIPAGLLDGEFPAHNRQCREATGGAGGRQPLKSLMARSIGVVGDIEPG